MEMIAVEVALFVLSGLFVVLWWFYRQRDLDRKEDIEGMGRRLQKHEDLITEIRLTYTKSDDFKNFTARVFDKLEEITTLLHTKADRRDTQ